MITKILQEELEQSGLEIMSNLYALESPISGKIVNVDDTPLEIKIITDKFIKFNNLREVNNPIPFEQGREPTAGGLFSDFIFGTTPEERMRQYAYIDLKVNFFHPYVFEVLTKVYRNVKRISAAEGSWHIDDSGKLTEIKSQNSPLYDPDATGLSWLIENFKKINWENSDARKRMENLKFLRSLSDDELFVSKWIVIPVFYRDIDMSSKRMAPHELNEEYNKLIAYGNMLDTSGIFGFMNNKTMHNMQLTLIKIRKYGQAIIESKHGAFRQSVLGKSIDYGMRSVISISTFNDVELPIDNPIDMFHTGLPLSQCIVTGKPYMLKWIEDWFQRTFDNVDRMLLAKRTEKGFEYEEVPIQDQLAIYTTDYIEKQMSRYIYTYGNRFEPIRIYGNDSSVELSIPFVGDSRGKTIRRPMTWTDLFYLAAMNSLLDKHVYITRYPLTSYLNIYPTLVYPVSTIKTIPIVIDGILYKHYPIIDPTMSDEKIGTFFIDTAMLCNLVLAAIGGRRNCHLTTLTVWEVC